MRLSVPKVRLSVLNVRFLVLNVRLPVPNVRPTHKPMVYTCLSNGLAKLFMRLDGLALLICLGVPYIRNLLSLLRL